MAITEFKTVEAEILNHLQRDELKWRYEPGDRVTLDYRAGDERETLLIPILREKLKLLNPSVVTSDDRADQILARLRMIRDNAEWLAWLRGEKAMAFSVNENAIPIRLVDFDDPSANDFLCTNQLWVQGAARTRPDILLFLNGVPVVDIEAKTAARGHIDWAQGAKQTARYEREIAHFYASMCFCVGVNELFMKYGIPGTRLQFWHQWRDPAPHSQIPAFDEMKCSLYGLFDRGNLLDMIRNFIVFDFEEGRVVKKVARYQQFRATNKIVHRALTLNTGSDQRRGIVWHTQGSGKSLTMIFAARKLWTHPTLRQPTIVIVVDREQLEEQMAGDLFRTNTENVIVAEKIDHLHGLIGSDYRGVILTIVNKFEAIESELSMRSDVILLVDEAHRSQYGDLGVFMRSALPNASMFGLTGTPLELDDRNTPRAFGRVLADEKFERYMDRYTIEDAIRDGATKPIHYEVRLSDWTVEHADLDAKFERLFADRSEEERRQLLGEARLDAILKHPRRIAQIAEDAASHFVEKIRPNGFKAMLVCRDKEMCALYKVALDARLQVEIGEDLPELTRVIVSEDPSHDSEAIRSLYLGGDRRKAIEDFKRPSPRSSTERGNPENRFSRTEIVIVCDMLLTGFDAPVVQAMYLDKGLHDHTLLQAIARVNRPYDDLKAFGLVLDYFGVFENLNEALHFDKSELGDVAFPVGKFFEMFDKEVSELLNMFEGVARDGSHAGVMAALLLLNDDDRKRNAFEKTFRNARILFETVQPDERLRPFLDDYAWLCKLYILYRKKFYPKEHFEVTAEDGAKTRALIREHVDVQALESDFPTYRLDENYLTKLEGLEPDAKALDIEAMLDAEIRVRLDEDEDIRPLSERLKRIIEQKRAGSLAGITLLNELEELAKQVVDILQEAERPVTESIAKEVLARLDTGDAGLAVQVATALLEEAADVCFPDWFLHRDVDVDLYRAFTLRLNRDFNDLRLHAAGSDFVERSIRLLRKVRFANAEDASERRA